ncbi:hypothetical protein [Haloferula sargassicola]|uniref:Uncharacterized protein n=1 Tax=Haloferula sargassicola TaxID=490096 RepID=A0ABP9UJZ0_9BACT
MGDSQVGIFITLVGVIALVLGGIAISLLAETQPARADSTQSLVQTIGNDRVEIERLQSEIHRLRQRKVISADEQKQVASELKDTRMHIATLELRRESLIEQRKQLKARIPELTEEFEDYRHQKRDEVRQRMVGTYLGDLSLIGRSGYRDCRITGFKPGVMRISHSGGNAAIPLSALPEGLRERLLWEQAEAADEPARKHASKRVAPSRQTPRSDARPAASPTEIAVARARYIAAQASLNELQTALNDARNHMNGRRRSAPGSLETYAERAERLGRLLARQTTTCADCRRELHRLNPRDPLLLENRN